MPRSVKVRLTCGVHALVGVDTFDAAMALVATVSVPCVVICDVEQGLSPRETRARIATLREQANFERCFILTTRSPIVLNEFRKDFLEDILVADASYVCRLTDIQSRSYLEHFAPGDLYDREVFGIETPSGDTQLKTPSLGHLSGVPTWINDPYREIS